MDVLRKTYQQFLELFNGMSPSQKGTLVAVTVTVVAALGLLVYSGTSSTTYVPLSVGKLFTVEEIIRAEEALMQQGLTDFKRTGQRILVPKDKVQEYNSALVASGSLPQNWAEEWEKQFSNLSAISNPREMTERKELARAKLASEMVASIPDVESANVMWDKDESRGFRKEQKSTATVFVRPKRGKELTASLASSIRQSIAGMKADLSPQDVTVMDMVLGNAHFSEKSNDPLSDRMLIRQNKFKEGYRQEILSALDYIKDVIVAVNVELDDVQASRSHSQTPDAKNVAPRYVTSSTHTETSRQTPQKNEPGQAANQPQSLRTRAGIDKSDQKEFSESTELSMNGFTITSEERTGAMPQEVHVSVQIPETYYRAVAMQTAGLAADAKKEDIDAAVATVKTEVDKKVEESVKQVVPRSSTANETRVNVSSYVSVDTVEAEPTVPITQTVGVLASQWGSTVALAFFGLWAVWMLNSSMKKAADSIPPPPSLEPEAEVDGENDPDLLDIPPPDTRNRDSLQHLVRDNPEMAASIISKWMRDDA